MDLTTILDETKALTQFWRGRNAEMEDDRRYTTLAKPIVKSDQVKWISNEPKVFFETSVALISSYPPRFRIPLNINFDAEEKDKISKTERFVQGIFRSLDDRQYRLGRSYWLREFAWWVCSGWYAVFNYVRKGRDGSTEFIAELFDPITVYPQWDDSGLLTLVRTYNIDSITALSTIENYKAKGLQFDLTLMDATTHEVINWWKRVGDKVYNAILLDKQIVKGITPEPFDHIPVHIGAVGSPDRLTDNWQERTGENIISANKDMYDYTNTIVSLMASIMAETAYPNIVSQTRTGAPAVNAEDIRGYGSQLNIKLEDKLEILKHAATPVEALQLLQLLLKQSQKGSIPDVVYGGVPQSDVSGFALSQYMAAIKYKISPYLNTMQKVMSEIASDFLIQFKQGDFEKVKLSSRNTRDIRKGMFYVEEFTKKDVPDYLYIDVTVPVTSAVDKTQQIIFARQALQAPQLVSRETLWDEVLDIQDSEQEYMRILQDQMLDDPMVKQLGILEQLRQREALLRAQNRIGEAQVLHQYILSIEFKLGMRQSMPIVPGQREGVPPNVMPPEMSPSGAPSPDQIGAAVGNRPPGLNRPPQTAEQRMAGQGRRGMLVSPSGQTLL